MKLYRQIDTSTGETKYWIKKTRLAHSMHMNTLQFDAYQLYGKLYRDKYKIEYGEWDNISSKDIY